MKAPVTQLGECDSYEVKVQGSSPCRSKFFFEYISMI